MAKVTIKEIAELANVSPAAVSMAIRGRKGISEETRANILHIAQSMGYRSPQRSRTLCGESIFFLLDEAPNPLCSAVLAALAAYVRESGGRFCVLPLEQALNDPEQALSGCALLISFDVIKRTLLDRLSAFVPDILILDADYARRPFYNIRMDYAGASYLLAKYLSDLGHRSMIYLNKDLPLQKNLLCFSGFQRLNLELHLPLNPSQIVMDLSTDPNVWAHFPDIIRSNNISAIICTSQAAAEQAIANLENFGLQVPEDISVAAIISDAESAPDHLTHVSLSRTFFQNQVYQLISTLGDRQQPSDCIVPCSEVCPGSSTGAPKFLPAAKKLAIILYLKEHPSLRVVRAGFLNMVQQLGYQAEVVGISGDDAEEYTAVCRALVQRHDIDGIISWLEEPEALDILKASGIPFVCLHGADPACQSQGWRAGIAVDCGKIAATVVDFIAPQLQNQTGCFAVSRAGDNYLETGITKEVIRLMRSRCPQITVLHDLFLVHHTQENVRRTTQYIRSHPDLLGAFSTAGYAAATWLEAKKALGRTMLIVGTDYSDETISAVESGELDAFIAQPLYEEAQLGVCALDTILRGKEYPVFTTLDAPLVTRQNVEKYKVLLQEVKNWYV